MAATPQGERERKRKRAGAVTWGDKGQGHQGNKAGSRHRKKKQRLHFIGLVGKDGTCWAVALGKNFSRGGETTGTGSKEVEKELTVVDLALKKGNPEGRGCGMGEVERLITQGARGGVDRGKGKETAGGGGK